MTIDLTDTLVIGISATALFDLSEGDKIFQANASTDPEKAINDYRDYMLNSLDKTLRPGTGYPLVQAILNLNKFQNKSDNPLVEVVILSRNTPETAIRVFKNVRQYNLSITRSAFTGGEPVTDYLESYDIDLFLTTNSEDAQVVMDKGNCAVALLRPPPDKAANRITGQVRIAFDADAVIFSEESEVIFKTKGIESFKENEDKNKDTPLNNGPYAVLLHKISRLQDRLPQLKERSPVRIAIVTARNSPAELRVINTLREWGVYVDEIFFLGGLDKSRVLKAFNPHIFFDDQDSYLDQAQSHIPSGKVPYKSDSILKKPL